MNATNQPPWSMSTGQSKIPEEINQSDKSLKEKVIDVIKTCFDPEIPVNIYELGLIYDVLIQEDNEITVKMTLTSPHCPVAESLPLDVESRIRQLDGIDDVNVDIVWEPPWNQDMMSEAAKLQLNML